jgi:hypothetical protein
MQFTMSVAAFVAMASSVLAQTVGFDSVHTPENNAVVPAGQVFEVTWTAPEKYADETVSIQLIGGATQGSQQVLSDLASGIPNTDQVYLWTVDASLGAHAVYGLKVILDSDPSVYQFSMPFQIEGEAESVTVDTSGLPITVTSSYGTVTVTLSSAEATTTSEVETTTTSAAETTSTSTSTSEVESTTSSIPTTTLSTITRNETTSVETSTTAIIQTSTTVITPTPTPSGGAGGEDEEEGNEDAPSGAAGLSAPLALVGALAMAFLAL